jgi:peptidoglycan/xylan/chitin deacetylase (PgdA/CDA1 family)
VLPIKLMILGGAVMFGLAAVARRATRSQLRILCYHGVWVTPGFEFGNHIFIGADQFERRMARLKRSGRPVLPLGEAVERLVHDDLPDAAVAITIDDGWASTLTHMVPVLEAYELPATLYASTWYSGHDLPVVNVAADYLRAAAGRRDIDLPARIAEIEALPVEARLQALRDFGATLGVAEHWLERRQFSNMSAAEIAEAGRRGLDIQLHTHRHIDVTMRVDELPGEIADNRAFLSAATGERRFEHFCYPSGRFHPRAPELLAASGVRSATTTERGLNAPGSDLYALRRFLDGRRVTNLQFDAYLSGLLHFTSRFSRLIGRRARPPAQYAG